MSMYGTVARIQIKPGTGQEFSALLQQETIDDPGIVAGYFYRADNEPDTYYLVAVFESKEAYAANSQRPETGARFQKMMAFFAAEPEWHDGTIVSSTP